MTMRAAVWPIVLAGVAAFLNLYSTQPLLPLLAAQFHASALQVGLTVTAPTVAVAIFAPLVGRLADTTGLRRVIVGSAFLLAIATALAATSSSLAQLIAWRFVQGIVTPGVFAASVAYIHERWPVAQAGRATAAYMTGTIIGGFLGRASAGLIASDANWHLSFVALAVGALALAIALWRYLPDERIARLKPRAPDVTADAQLKPRAPDADRGARGLSRAISLSRNRRLVATWAIGFCVLFTNVAMFTYVTFHLAAPPFGLSTAALGWLFVVYVVGAIVTPLSGGWIDTYGHRLGIGAAIAIGTAGALMTLAPWLWAIVIGLALTSTGVFVAQTATSSYIGVVTENDRGLAVGLYSTFYYAGGSVGGIAPALVWEAGGWPACVELVVLVQVAGAAIAFTQWTTSAGAGSCPESRSPEARRESDAIRLLP